MKKTELQAKAVEKLPSGFGEADKCGTTFQEPLWKRLRSGWGIAAQIRAAGS